jgi:hypothetical protein
LRTIARLEVVATANVTPLGDLYIDPVDLDARTKLKRMSAKSDTPLYALKEPPKTDKEVK